MTLQGTHKRHGSYPTYATWGLIVVGGCVIGLIAGRYLLWSHHIPTRIHLSWILHGGAKAAIAWITLGVVVLFVIVHIINKRTK